MRLRRIDDVNARPRATSKLRQLGATRGPTRFARSMPLPASGTPRQNPVPRAVTPREELNDHGARRCEMPRRGRGCCRTDAQHRRDRRARGPMTASRARLTPSAARTPQTNGSELEGSSAGAMGWRSFLTSRVTSRPASRTSTSTGAPDGLCSSASPTRFAHSCAMRSWSQRPSLPPVALTRTCLSGFARRSAGPSSGCAGHASSSRGGASGASPSASCGRAASR